MQPSPTCRQEGEGADRVGDKWAWAAAARGGHLPVLEWLRSQACPWDESACSAAAEGGQLAALQWLRRRGAPWDFLTCAKAAGAGHLEVLRWAHAQGCPLSEHVQRLALRGEHVHVLRWAADVGCPADLETRELAAALGVALGDAQHVNKIPPGWPRFLPAGPAFWLIILIRGLKWARKPDQPWGFRAQGEPPRPEAGPAAGPRPGLV
jgi:hypothetical protein